MVSWPSWSRKAAKAGKTAVVSGQIISTVHGSVTDLPQPLAEQYREYTAEVRTEATRADIRDRLDSATRQHGAPVTSQDIKKLRKQIRPR